MPPLTPYLGPYILLNQDLKNSSRYSLEKDILTDLAGQIPRSILTTVHRSPEMTNSLPLIWLSYHCSKRYTYQITRSDPTAIWERIDSKQRNIIRKAQDLYSLQHIEDAGVFYTLNRKTFERQKLQTPYSSDFFATLDHTLKTRNSRSILGAFDGDGNLDGAIYLAEDSRCTYLLAIGSDPTTRHLGAIPFLIWSALSNHQDKTFDFEGSMIPSIESFFRSFGGSLVTYDRLYHTPNKWTDLLLRITGKI